MRKHKAILKGKVWEEYWKMEIPRGVHGGGYYAFCPISMSLRDRDTKSLELYSMRDASCVKSYRMKCFEEFWTGNIDMPFLEAGEKLFVADMDAEVIVEEKIRTTEENTCIYLVDYSVRIDTSSNPKEAKNYVVREFDEKREALIKDIAELDKEIERLSGEKQERAREQEESDEKSGLVPWLKRLIGRD